MVKEVHHRLRGCGFTQPRALFFYHPFNLDTEILFSIRSTSVPKMFMNSADDMLARSTVETWVIKAQKGDPGSD